MSYQRSDDETPYWRTLKANGELNAKYPGGIEAQKEKLEEEGFTIIQKGRKNVRYYVKDYEDAILLINSRPRKCLGYISPIEAFSREFK